MDPATRMPPRTWAFVSYGAIGMFVTGMIGPIMPIYLRSIDFPIRRIGVIIAVSGLTSALLSLFFGNLADRFDRSRLFIGSAVAFAILPLGYVWAQNTGQFVVLQALAGVIGPLAGVTSQAILMDLAIASGRRGEVMGTARAVRSSMFVIGPLVGGAIATLIVVRAVFVIESLLLLAITCLAAAALRGQQRPAVEAGPVFELPALLKNRAVLALLGILLLDFLNFQALLFVFPLYASDVGLKAVMIGVLITTQSLAYAIVQKPVGKLADRGNVAPMLAVCAIAGGPLIFLLSLTRSAVLLGVIMLLVGLASAPIFLLVTIVVSEAAGEKTGVAMGMIGSVVYLAAGLAPLLTSLLSAVELRYGFLLPVAGSLLAVPLLVVVVQSRRAARTSEDTSADATPDTAMES